MKKKVCDSSRDPKWGPTKKRKTTKMEYCDTFVREKHIEYIIEVGNDKTSLAAVLTSKGKNNGLDCYRTLANEWSLLGIMCS